MTVVCICVREIDAVSGITDTSVVSRVDAALDELEASCSSPTERILALEEVHGMFAGRRPSVMQTPFGRFIARHVDLRQDRIMTEYGPDGRAGNVVDMDPALTGHASGRSATRMSREPRRASR